MKKTIPVIILLVGLAAYVGYYLGQKNAPVDFGNAKLTDVDFKLLLKKYLENSNYKTLIEPIDETKAKELTDNYNKGHKEIIKKELGRSFKGDSLIRSDAKSLWLFASLAFIKDAQSIDLSFAQHSNTSSSAGVKYGGYLTMVVTAKKDGILLPIPSGKDKAFTETSKYYDVFSLCPPDICP
jgi:hypothetical protein